MNFTRFAGAADRDRTGTVSLPRDFKSLASANSTTAAYLVVFLILADPRPIVKRNAPPRCFSPFGKDKPERFAFGSIGWRRHPDLNRGIRVLQTLALPLGYSAIKKTVRALMFGAGNETRTRDIHLGKVTLYH